MNKKYIFNLAMVLALIVTSFEVSQPAAAQGPAKKYTPRFNADAEAVPGELVVAFSNSEGKNLIEKIEQAVQTADETGGEVTRLSTDGDAVIRVDGDIASAADELNQQPNVLYAEPNYIFSLPVEQQAVEGYSASSDYVYHAVAPSLHTGGKSIMAIPRATVEGMVSMGVYPTDKYLTINQGWYAMGAAIVWSNKTASANICEIDTGVDIKHPDLVTKSGTKIINNVIAGYDFVNADTSPQDDNGHGTHVAGIMVATRNNSIGMAGVSTGKVVAVKALDPQGNGTSFDVSKAIKYCADRTDIRVINLSLGGTTPATAIHDALLYATKLPTETISGGTYDGLKGKGKLVVVAAGNKGNQVKTYPAAYADTTVYPEFGSSILPGKSRILSVGATGLPDGDDVAYECRALFSNYGTNWVNVSAPGFDIYSTTPYDKPFYLNVYGNANTRYDFMSGTSMAAAFVSASAARRMGYKPTENSEEVAKAIMDTGDPLDPNCTASEMLEAKRVNVAKLMDRAGVTVSVFDAVTGVALDGATVALSYVDAGVTVTKTATIAPSTEKATLGIDLDPARIFTYYFADTDILDVATLDKNGNPIPSYTLKVTKSGYTNGYQSVFRQDDLTSLTSGVFNVFLNGAVPPLTANFEVVLGWHKWQQPSYKEAVNAQDLDLYVWLPQAPGVDIGQPAPFIVGYGGDAFGYVEGDPYGTMNAFPFARLKREGGYLDGGPTLETTTIKNRAAHGPVPANAALPYYAGKYWILATDYGQTIDRDNDGCGDNYGINFKPIWTGTPGTGGPNYYDPTLDPDCASGSLGIPLLGAYFTPYVYVWKDGSVRSFVDGSNNHQPWPDDTTVVNPDINCNDHWWKALSINSSASSTAPAYQAINVCDNGSAPGFIPYTGVSISGDRLTFTGLGK